jgi:hypothetical protein
MAKKLYDLAVKVGTYEKDGKTKGRYQNIGAVLEGENGKYLLLDRYFNPAGVPNPDDRANVIVSMFEPKQGGGNSAPAQPSNSDSFDDDVPF